MGWYGPPEDEIIHFDINRDVIKETKERRKESAKYKGTANRLAEGGDIGAESGATSGVAHDSGTGQYERKHAAESSSADASDRVAGADAEAGL